MWTQRDQIQAYQFVRRRVVSSVLAGDANTPSSPNRRPLIAGWLSLVALLLVCATFAVIGFLHKNTRVNWRAGGQILVLKDTASVFVFGTDQRLHPMVNYTSARLLVGAGAKTVSVTEKDLADAPRGVPLGIVGAPGAVPSSARLATGPWQACSSRSMNSPSSAEPSTSLQLGVPALGHRLPAGSGLLVSDPSHQLSLIAGGKRYRLASSAVLTALGFAALPPVPVSAAWLSSVASAGDLATIAVGGAGRPGPSVGGRPTLVGQVLRVRTVSGTDQYFLVRADGLEPVSAATAALVLAHPDEAAAYPGRMPSALEVSSADVSAVSRSEATAPAVPLSSPPEPVRVGDGDGDVAVCATGTGSGPAAITVSDRLPARPAMIAISQPNALEADLVQVAPGTGALVLAKSAPAATGSTVYLVTDAGVKYPITSTDAKAALGYGSVTPTPVRSALLALLPTGVPLNPAAASRVVQ